MSLLSVYRAALAAVKTTSSELVEWVSDLASLPKVHNSLADWMNEHGVLWAGNSGDLQGFEETDGHMAFLQGVGMFYYLADGTGPDGDIHYESTDGGSWNYYYTAWETMMADAGSPSDGKVLMYNSGAQGVQWNTPTVASLDWANVSNKPIITGTTNPVMPGTVTVGALNASGNSSVNGTLSVSSHLSVTGNGTIGAALTANTANIAGATTVGGTLTLTTGAVTGNVTASGNVSAGGTLTATGAATLNGGATIGGASTSISGTAAANAAALSVSGSYVSFFNAKSSGGGSIAGVQFPSWTTAGRPTLLLAGLAGFNTTLNKLECYDGSGWNSLW